MRFAVRLNRPLLCSFAAIVTGDFDFGKTAEGSSYAVPTKKIARESDVQAFLQSDACKDYMSFVKCLCRKLVGVKISDVTKEPVSTDLQPLLDVLATLSSYVDEIPPKEHTLRYGNPAFRDWHARMCENAERLTEGVLPEALRGAAKELAYYLADSFGNRTRIDYGTGH